MNDSLKERLLSAVLATSSGYRLYLRRKHGAKRPEESPHAPWHNAVLKTNDEVQGAVAQVTRLGLPPHNDTPKNWDSLAALDAILARTGPAAYVLDAGAESYSRILTWLFLYGYKNLYGINLAFDRPTKLGPIRYEPGDATATRFSENTFDAITCLSVIEHGVDLGRFFREMARLLKRGGILIVSTDYFETPIDTSGSMAYGVPIHIFSRSEISDALALAAQFGFSSTSPLDLGARDRVVHWAKYSLRYTFLVFTLQKSAGTWPRTS